MHGRTRKFPLTQKTYQFLQLVPKAMTIQRGTRSITQLPNQKGDLSTSQRKHTRHNSSHHFKLLQNINSLQKPNAAEKANVIVQIFATDNVESVKGFEEIILKVSKKFKKCQEQFNEWRKQTVLNQLESAMEKLIASVEITFRNLCHAFRTEQAKLIDLTLKECLAIEEEHRIYIKTSKNELALLSEQSEILREELMKQREHRFFITRIFEQIGTQQFDLDVWIKRSRALYEYVYATAPDLIPLLQAKKKAPLGPGRPRHTD